MKLTKTQLKRIIKEELQKVLQEEVYDAEAAERCLDNLETHWEFVADKQGLCSKYNDNAYKILKLRRDKRWYHGKGPFKGRVPGKTVLQQLKKEYRGHDASWGAPKGESAREAAERKAAAAPGEGRIEWSVPGDAGISAMEREEQGQIADQYQAVASYALKGNKKALAHLQWAAKYNQDAQMMLDAVYEKRPDLNPETKRRAKASPLSPEELEYELGS